MGLLIALKAFLKALKEPKSAQQFLDGNHTEIEAKDPAHLRLLSILQHSGRLIDFLKEDISQYSDSQVGAAVRKIHQDCAKVLEDHITLRPVRSENEGESIQIPSGYDSTQIKVVGKVKGEPPYKGILVHKGWKAHKRSLPKKIGEQAVDIICPAEVEIHG